MFSKYYIILFILYEIITQFYENRGSVQAFEEFMTNKQYDLLREANGSQRALIRMARSPQQTRTNKNGEPLPDTIEVKAITYEPQDESMITHLKATLLNIPEDADLPITSLIPKYGYPLEVHHIRTADGYILTVYRIPRRRGKRHSNDTYGPPVIVMHGITSSSDDWIISGPGKALGYILADAGYDVWLGNARGTKHSRTHANLSPNQFEFWDFGYEEIGLYDLPAMIDYILDKRGTKTLYYIGHSQGTTVFFVMCSMRPEYNSKIRSMLALAPVAWNSHMASPVIRALAWQTYTLDVFRRLLSLWELPSAGDVGSQLLELACNERVFTQPICSYNIFILNGFNYEEMNDTLLPAILSHYPAGCSTRQLIHFGQTYLADDFRRYDFGRSQNIAAYGQPTPPSYNVTRVSAPVYLLHANNDYFSVAADIQKLYDRLPNVAGVYLVPKPRFNHIDFLWGCHAKTLVYDVVLDILKRF